MNTDVPATDPAYDENVSLFDYEKTDRVPTEVTGIEESDGAVIHDLSFAGLGQEQRILAYFVTPPVGVSHAGPVEQEKEKYGKGLYPVVIYLHPAPGSRVTFLEEAVQQAKNNSASLLLDAPWAQGEAWASTLVTPEGTRDSFLAFLRDLRRAVDFLETRPEVDASRVGFVGHSIGALFGGVLSGIEKRIKAYVLVAGAPSFTDVMAVNMPNLKGEALDQFAAVIQPIDPAVYLPHAAPSALLFQFGEKDEAFARDKLERFAEAGSEPKSVQWYDADHMFTNGAGRAERLEWLNAQLIV